MAGIQGLRRVEGVKNVANLKGMRTLSAPGLTLEPQVAAHAPELFRVLIETGVHDFLDDAPPPSPLALRERLARLETRGSADGREQWLNWVIRLATGEVAGFVQATVPQVRPAWIAFVLGSSHWGRGIAHRASLAMMAELHLAYGVTHLLASAERKNARSTSLLQRLGFAPASPALHLEYRMTSSEVLMERMLPPAASGPPAPP